MGVSIQNDARELYLKWDLGLAAWVDLPTLVYRILRDNVPTEVFRMVAAAAVTTASLKKIATCFFGSLCLPFEQIDGSGAELRRRVAYSFWPAAKLSPRQFEYAAFDAQVGLEVVLRKLPRKRKLPRNYLSDICLGVVYDEITFYT